MCVYLFMWRGEYKLKQLKQVNKQCLIRTMSELF